MRRDDDRVADIIDAAETILRLTRDADADSFAADDVLSSACFFHTVIIGEAIAALKAGPNGARRPTDAPIVQANPELPWQLWIGMRNLVVHRYHGRDERLLWQDIRSGHLERLRDVCRAWLTGA